MRSHELSERVEPASEIDLPALWAAVKRRRRMIIVPTLLAFIGISIFVNVVTPRYTAETQVLLENQETVFTRPDRVNQPEQTNVVDQEAVASQVQLIASRDIARRAIQQLKLAGDPEFDPLARGLNPLSRILVLFGASSDPTRETAENRMIAKFLDKLTVFSPPKTRVITIQFTSRNPDLAVRVANTVAQLFLQEQSAAKRATARRAADALAAQIADLRTKLIAADDEREKYRLQSGLLAGTNNMTITGQQLADVNGELSKARNAQAEAQAKASMIRELIRSGKEADVQDVTNNELVRRVSEQLVGAQAQLARDSRTLLPGHPHIKELAAQVAEYRQSLKNAAKKTEMTLQNEARIAGQRVANLEAVLTQQKKEAGVANADEVHLRSLERVTQSYKDQLESSSTKYQEALARQASAATPSDARIISGASRPEEPSFPKKIPFIAFGTILVFVLMMGFVMAIELLTGRAMVRTADQATFAAREPTFAPTAPVAPSAPQPSAATVDPRNRRSWTYPDEAPEPDAADPVFGPVSPKAAQRPSADRMSLLASGGMLDATLSYLKTFGRSAAASRVADGLPAAAPTPTPRASKFGWADEDLVPSPAQDTPRAADPSDQELMSDKIVAAHVPGRGVHIVGTVIGHDRGLDYLIGLGRTLSIRGRAIVVDLNATPAALAPLAREADGRSKVSGMRGLAELLAGDTTFAEVIHRDSESRLHFIPTGLHEADFRDFDLILDALSETYDFILLLAPGFPQNEIAKVMAPYADFVVLAGKAAKDDAAVAELESELIGAGAREVFVAGSLRSSRQDVA